MLLVATLLSWTLPAVLGTLVALALFGAGAWFQWGGRAQERREERQRESRVRELAGTEPLEPETGPTTIREWRDGLTVATRSVVGLGTMILGYHALAWSQDGLGLATFVSADRWWILPAAVGGLAILSRAIDRGTQ